MKFKIELKIEMYEPFWIARESAVLLDLSCRLISAFFAIKLLTIGSYPEIKFKNMYYLIHSVQKTVSKPFSAAKCNGDFPLLSITLTPCCALSWLSAFDCKLINHSTNSELP